VEIDATNDGAALPFIMRGYNIAFTGYDNSGKLASVAVIHCTANPQQVCDTSIV
jgi:hypothetical protein